MKYYLSSYKIGNRARKLKSMVPKGKKLGFIPNAMDHIPFEQRQESNGRNIKYLTDLGIRIELLDLKKYFGREKALRKKINSLGGVWVRGGNTFVLRQAMRLSGFDTILKEIATSEDGDNFFYGGFSAGGCVLSPSLKNLTIVDNPKLMPYGRRKVVWEGLGLINYVFMPHYKSDHPESKDIDREIARCKRLGIKFKPVRDGEVIIIESKTTKKKKPGKGKGKRK